MTNDPKNKEVLANLVVGIEDGNVKICVPFPEGVKGAEGEDHIMVTLTPHSAQILSASIETAIEKAISKRPSVVSPNGKTLH